MNGIEKTINEFEELLLSISNAKAELGALRAEKDGIVDLIADSRKELEEVKSDGVKVSEAIKSQQANSKRIFDQETKRLEDKEVGLNEKIHEVEGLKKELKSNITLTEDERKGYISQRGKTVKSDEEIKELKSLADIDRNDGALLLSAATKTNAEALALRADVRAEQDDAFAATNAAVALQTKNKAEEARLKDEEEKLDERDSKVSEEEKKLGISRDALNNRDLAVKNSEDRLKIDQKNVNDKEKNLENMKKELALSIAKYKVKQNEK